MAVSSDVAAAAPGSRPAGCADSRSTPIGRIFESPSLQVGSFRLSWARRRACGRGTLAHLLRMWRCDFMSAHDPAEAVEVLDLLLKFFSDGERWVKGRLSDRRGNCCLVGALDFVSSHHAMKADAAEWYLADEISVAGDSNGHIEDCAKFRAGLRRAMAGQWHRTSEAVLRR